MTTYLVTGAAGFIASKVCEFLLADGHQVVGIDNLNDAYDPQDNAFSGSINWIELDVGEAAVDLDHYISPEERMSVVLSRH